MEQAVIDAYRASGLPLTNLVVGHGSAERGLARAEDVVATRGAQPAPDLPRPCLLVKLNNSWRAGISAADLYAATRGNWGPSASTRRDVRGVFGMYGEVIRSAYAVAGWQPATAPGEGHLWEFAGTAEPELQRYVGTHVRDLIRPTRRNFRVLR